MCFVMFRKHLAPFVIARSGISPTQPKPSLLRIAYLLLEIRNTP